MSDRSAGRLRIEASAEEAGKTVARLLHDRGGLSHARAKGLIAAGAVRRNGERVLRVDERLSEGDRIEAVFEADRSYRAPKRDRSTGPGFRVVFEDDHLIVVDKEAGFLTVPIPSLRGESLQDLLTARERLRGRRDSDVRAVHRIDRFTSGLVAYARDARTWSALRRAFASGEPERVYLAVVEGLPDPPAGRLEHPLHEDAKSLKVRVAPPGSASKPSSLRYRVRERFDGAALVEVRLETGRRNQIRVQFAAERHPLVGDRTYGTESPLIGRVALHAWRLALAHPVSGERLRYEAELPSDFRKLLRALRRAATAPVPVPVSEITRPRGRGPRYR